MEFLFSASILCGVTYRSLWQPWMLPITGVALAVVYGLWRGGIGGAVFGVLGVAVNAGFLAYTLWWTRRRSKCDEA